MRRLGGISYWLNEQATPRQKTCSARRRQTRRHIAASLSKASAVSRQARTRDREAWGKNRGPSENARRVGNQRQSQSRERRRCHSAECETAGGGGSFARDRSGNWSEDAPYFCRRFRADELRRATARGGRRQAVQNRRRACDAEYAYRRWLRDDGVLAVRAGARSRSGDCA